MKNINIINEEILNMEQLDNISGGTVDEFNEIYSTMEKKMGVVGDISNGIRKIGGAIPVAGQIGTVAWNNAGSRIAERILKDSFGIKANISIGWGGTGFRESDNYYSKDGKNLTHGQVLDLIKAA